jgi:hypothetical protein
VSASEKSNDETVSAPSEDESPRDAGHSKKDDKHPVPLFLRDGNDGRKDNAQDEKDEIGE